MINSDQVSKYTFTRDYEINASPRILFPYLSTPDGLAKWFCEDASILDDKVFNFIWDKTDHFAEIIALRNNRSIRFAFLDAARQPVTNPDFIEFSVETSELTEEVYLNVVDYSAKHNEDELEELWENLIFSLREVIGGQTSR